MKLYATTTSERSTKGQGGNEYLNIDINVTDQTQPQYRARVINDTLKDGTELGQIYISFEAFYFGKWKQVYTDTVFTNVEPKGEKQKTAKCGICGKPTNGISCCIPL